MFNKVFDFIALGMHFKELWRGGGSKVKVRHIEEVKVGEEQEPLEEEG